MVLPTFLLHAIWHCHHCWLCIFAKNAVLLESVQLETVPIFTAKMSLSLSETRQQRFLWVVLLSSSQTGHFIGIQWLLMQFGGDHCCKALRPLYCAKMHWLFALRFARLWWLVDWFKRHINLSRDIPCLVVRESRSIFVHIYFFEQLLHQRSVE